MNDHLQWMYALGRFGIKPGLGAMAEIMEALGHPEQEWPSVHIAGTVGKGSTAAFMASVLREAGYRVGLYTSPHLVKFNERIQINGQHISDGDLAALAQDLREKLELKGIQATFFECTTALAFLYFARHHVDIAVVEVGMGGRLDATNVVQQAVSVLGPIAIDHVEILGADAALIAREKGGIIKPRQTVFTAPQSGVVTDVLKGLCEAEGVPLLTCGRDLTVSIHQHELRGLDVTVTGLRGLYESLRIPLAGRHQAQNAALAIGALEALSPTGVPHTVVERGLAQVTWPGRIEVVHEEPLVVMDGAHNAHAAAALRETLVELLDRRRIHLLVGMSADKSVEGVGEALGKLAVSATCTRSRHPRAMDPAALAKRLGAFCPDVHVMSDAADAYTYLLNAVPASDAIVVTGSLYLVGELRAALRNANGRATRSVTATL